MKTYTIHFHVPYTTTGSKLEVEGDNIALVEEFLYVRKGDEPVAMFKLAYVQGWVQN